MAYTKSELVELGAVLRKYPDVLVATDDMYEHILWTEEEFNNILTVNPDLYDRTIVLNGVSKAYSMTGWRIGYAAGPQPLIAAMKKIQSQSTSNPTSISQVAAQAALEGDQQCVNDMVKVFKQRHDYTVKALNEIDGIECLAGDGTFYVFPDFSGMQAKLNCNTDTDLAEKLLEAGVALVPGSAFGTPGHMRISFATSDDNLQKAVQRLAAASN